MKFEVIRTPPSPLFKKSGEKPLPLLNRRGKGEFFNPIVQFELKQLTLRTSTSKTIKYFIFIFITFLLSTNGSILFAKHWYEHKKNMPIILADTSIKRYDFFLKMKDGVKLDCTKFAPPKTSPNRPIKGWPILIACHGFGDSKATEIDFAAGMAQYGYYTFCYSMRGQGYSGGLSNLISTTEMNDLMEIIDYVKQDTVTVTDSNNVGIIGSSQGGIIPFMAACNGASVRCIMSDLASSQFASSWIENGCIKTTLFFSVNYDTSVVRYDKEVKNLRKYILSKDTADWDSLAEILPKNRDFFDQVQDNKVPVLITNAWQDKFFNASGSLNEIGKLFSPYRLYIGAINGHGSDTTVAENNFLTDFEDSWIDYWLNGIQNHVLDSAKYFYASSRFPLRTDNWSFTHYKSRTWPPDYMDSVRLFLLPNNIIDTIPDSNPSDTISFVNNVKDTSLTMLQAINLSFKGLIFASKFSKTALVFESSKLNNDVEMLGVPMLHLNYSSDAKVCQYNFQIWEVDILGKAHLVTRINYTDRHNKPNEEREIDVGGLAHSHVFLKGSKLRIVVTNLDTDPADSFLLSNPYVLPVLEKAKNVIYMGKDNPTYLEIPIRISKPTEVAEKENFENNGNITITPNPVSDVSYVEINMPDDSPVIISVYDIYGRKLENLYDGKISVGDIKIPINCSDLTPGVYILTFTGQYFHREIKFVKL